MATNLQIVDNHLGSWHKGKGGNGYFRGSRVWTRSSWWATTSTPT
ncbi:hypothetical protein [Lentzea sp. NPDC055074]